MAGFRGIARGIPLAKVPDMKLLVAVMAIIFATPVYGQNGVHPPQGWSLGVAAGGAAFTDFQRSELVATRVSAAGTVEQRDFPTRIGAETTGTLSAFLSYWPNGSWGLRAYGTYSPSHFQTVMTRSAAEFTGGSRLAGDSTGFAALRITSYQLQAVFRLPIIHGKVMPYGIVGGGENTYVVPNGNAPVPELAQNELATGTRHQAAGSVGLGTMLQTRRPGWALHFELLDRFSHTPVTDGPVRMLNAVTFTLGLSWKLSARD
jgi:hypothetical protein